MFLKIILTMFSILLPIESHQNYAFSPNITKPLKTSESFAPWLNNCHVWMWELYYKKVEHQKSDAFELWCWKILLRVTWTARRSNKSILKEISPEYSLEELKLKLQYFGHLMQRAGKDADAGQDWRREEKGTTADEMVGWHHRINGHEFWASSSSWWWTGRPGVLQSMGSQRLSDWTILALLWTLPSSASKESRLAS